MQVYFGRGKGKTTAALGQGFRATGHGFKVYMIQFMKGYPQYGEVKAIEKNKARKLFIFKTLEKVSIKGKVKNKALSLFKNKISDMLFVHLATMGKLTY